MKGDAKECRWCGRVFSPVEVPERFCSKKCARKAAGINLKGGVVKWLIVLCTILGTASAFTVTGQVSPPSDCPPDKVCLSREAALKALENADKVKAFEAQAKINDQAIADLKKEIENMRREFIQASVEASFYKQQVALQRLDIEKLLKMTKCKPFAICVNFAK